MKNDYPLICQCRTHPADSESQAGPSQWLVTAPTAPAADAAPPPPASSQRHCHCFGGTSLRSRVNVEPSSSVVQEQLTRPEPRLRPEPRGRPGASGRLPNFDIEVQNFYIGIKILRCIPPSVRERHPRPHHEGATVTRGGRVRTGDQTISSLTP